LDLIFLNGCKGLDSVTFRFRRGALISCKA
jgi:hypothetical protein